MSNETSTPTFFQQLSNFSKMSLFGGTVCLVLSFICTFLPWTTFLGNSYPGYSEFRGRDPISGQLCSMDHIYDGFAGKLNLLAAFLLLLCLGLVLKKPATNAVRLAAIL